MHYSKLTERKENLLKNIQKVGLDQNNEIIWVEQFDREKVIEQGLHFTHFRYNGNILHRHLTIAEISNGIAHNFIIREISEFKNEHALILEDDIVLKDGFTELLTKSIRNLPDDWEILNIGGDYRHPFKNDPNPVENTKIVNGPACVMTCCYLLSSRGAQRIIKHSLFSPFSMPIDTTLSVACPEMGIKCYWLFPFIAYEGSKSGLYFSSLERGF